MQLSKNRKTWETLFVLIVLVLANASVVFRVIWLVPAVMIGQAVLLILCAAVALWVLYKQDRLAGFWASLRRNWFIFPFLVFSFLSIFWSIQPVSSIFRWLIFVTTIILGGFMGLRSTLRENLNTLSAFSVMILVLSGLFIVLLPSLALMHYAPYEGTWQGIYWHKNHLGMVLALISLLFLINMLDSLRSSKPDKYFWGGLYLVALFFLVKSSAVGAYLTTIAMHGAFVLLYIWMKLRQALKPIHYLLFVLVCLVGAVVIFLNLDVIFGVFGRSTSLTGRIPMWQTLYETYFLKRPYLGYGFNAFWYYAPHRGNMAEMIGWSNPPVIADNGFFDILINTGVVGFALFLIFYVGLWGRSLQMLKDASSSTALFPAVFMVLVLVGNLAFSLIFETEAYFMLIMMLLLFTERVFPAEVAGKARLDQ